MATQDILNEVHPDVRYLMHESISMVLSQALAETFDQKPTDPVDFFAKFLLHQNSVRYQAQQVSSSLRSVQLPQQIQEDISAKAHNEAYEHARELQAAAEKKRLQAEEEAAKKKQSFFDSIESSISLDENLQQLVDFVQEHTGATGVYIGKLVHKKKPIAADANPDDDLDLEAPQVIQFVKASKNHASMVDTILAPEQAPKTHAALNFVEEPKPEGGEQPPVDDAPAEGQVEGANAQAKPAAEFDILTSYKHVYVPEVVTEPSMWFQTVPRLGSFMAVPIIYNSCLYDEALDAAIANAKHVTAENETLRADLAAHEAEQNQRAEAAAANNEIYEREPKEIQLLTYEPYQTKPVKYVLCVDTMGQDRELTEEQRRFILQTARAYKTQWERAEVQCLTMDRDRRIVLSNKDPQIEIDLKEKVSEMLQKVVDEKWAEDVASEAPASDQPAAVVDEEYRALEVQSLRLITQANLFVNGGLYEECLNEISELWTIKMPRIVQSLMFLMQIDRNLICEPNSNRLFWKRAKLQIREMAKRIANYEILGPKDGKYEGWQTINYCERLIREIQPEDVENYHVGFSKLFKWFQQAIALRKQDIIRRKALAKRACEIRETKIAEKAKRQQERETFLNEARDKFQADNEALIETCNRYAALQAKREAGEEIDAAGEELLAQEPPVTPILNMKEFEDKFDTENPEVEIPEEVVKEQDNDWLLNEAQLDAHITAYFEKKGQVTA